MNPKLRRKIVIVALIIGIALVFAVYFRGQRTWEEVKIATGPEGGLFLPLGEQLAWILGELPGNPMQKVTPVQTSGSVQNIKLLFNSEADIAFVFKPAIANATQAERAQIRALASLYTDVVQFVVRKDANINRLTDLEGKKAYVGPQESGTKIVAEEILKAVQVSDFTRIAADSFSHASEMLITGELQAAFFAAGTNADAVKEALKSGECNLLDLRADRDRIIERMPGLVKVDIPAITYLNQTTPVHTVGAQTLVLCRKNLDDDLVFLIENALFDNIHKLMRAQGIKLESALDEDKLPEGIALHSGARRFKEKEDKKLIIATGTIDGKYWHFGKAIQVLLEQRGIRARVIRTDGSLENAQLLMKQPALAIMQYDTALASHTGTSELIFRARLPDDIDIPTVSGMRRIGTLHKEKLHIIMRRDKLTGEEGPQPTIETLRDMNNVRICLGPKNSGTRILAQAVLNHSGMPPEAFTTLTSLPVLDMVNRIYDKAIDVGFFVGDVPSEALKTLLDDDQEIRLLSIEERDIAKLVGQVFRKDMIDAGTYGCQLEGDPAVETIGTTAVLVTTADLPFDVKKITKVIFEGADVIGITAEAMAKDLAIPLHSDAKAYYREANFPGYLPLQSPIDFLGDTQRSLLGFIHDWLVNLGVNAAMADMLASCVPIVLIIVLSVLAHLVAKHLILDGLTHLITRTETKWGNILLERKVLNRLSYLASALVIYVMATSALEGYDRLTASITSAVLIYMIVIGFLIIDALLNSALDIYHTFEVSKEIPIRSFVQAVKIAIYFTGGIFVVSFMLNKTPIYLFSGLGALTAVLMLIFKDTVLGFVAGIQLTANKMVAHGDWITMPKYGADGDVLEVALATVKIQNFDKTITTIPTYALISESFQNWRGMKESGGRRIKRAVYIDINTIKLCTEEMLERFSKIQYISEYIAGKKKEVVAYNAGAQVDDASLVNGRRLTNIGTFRAYVISYLKNHTMINQEMTFLVRQLAPTEHGLPIEIYVFCKDTVWANYEAIQADIFDHILAVVPEFDLKVFQHPVGSDFKAFAGKRDQQEKLYAEYRYDDSGPNFK